MKSEFKDGVFTVELDGRIDSNNAEAVGSEIAALRSATPDGDMVLDCSGLEYISSAGLRQVLKLRKSEKNLVLTDVSSEVYEIFDMTGFTEMLDIRKAYRQMSVDGCEVIGEGSNGIVYRIDPDTIIKVYKNPDALEDIERERELAHIALVMGVNTAISYDIVKVGDKYGSVFELLSAKCLTELIRNNPEDVDKYVGIMMEMLKEIHGIEAPENKLPDARENAVAWIEWLKGRIPDDIYEKASRMIKEVPKMNNMIHGDFHTGNIHYSNGEAIIIDMDTLSAGHPIFDWSSIYLAFVGFNEFRSDADSQVINLPAPLMQHIFEKSFEIYFADRSEEERAQILDKIKVVAYTRITRRTMKRKSDCKDEIEYYTNCLIAAVNKVDSIVF